MLISRSFANTFQPVYFWSILNQLTFHVCTKHVPPSTASRNVEPNCTDKLWQLVPSGSGLEDIKLAIQQLTMRSHTSNTGYSTSTYSSLSGSESSEPAVRRLMRHSSLETINTNVTNADEFVWVDSHNRYLFICLLSSGRAVSKPRKFQIFQSFHMKMYFLLWIPKLVSALFHN